MTTVAGQALVIRGDARALPLPDESVDLVVTSPPYFALRAYTDGGEQYAGQIGAEATPAEYIASLIECTREWMRVLKPTGSMFVNLGDAYSRGQRYDGEFTAEDAAWLAGVIDCDGSISIRADNSGRSHIAWTRVGQTRREVVERIRSITGTGQVWRDKRDVWNWNAAGQQARWVLERIWPWLRIKQRQALAAVDLMTRKEKVGGRGRWNPLSDAEIGYRETIRQAVLAWNRSEEFPDYEPPPLPIPAISGQPRWVPAKSLLLLPERYRIAAVDELGLIARAVVIWSKPNGLPESVTDRVRRSHEDWVHLTKQPRYYSAVDEIREPHARIWTPGKNGGTRAALAAISSQYDGLAMSRPHPLGKLPGSVWEIATEPLEVPEHLGVDHFAAFPTEWPKRIILGWSPPGICTKCGEGRRPVADSVNLTSRPGYNVRDQRMPGRHASGNQGREGRAGDYLRTVTGEVCACPEPTAPTRPAVVLDPFSGTGTTVLVASALGRHGIGVDMSADYCRLAQWRVNDPAQRAKVLGVAKPPAQLAGQQAFDFGNVA